MNYEPEQNWTFRLYLLGFVVCCLILGGTIGWGFAKHIIASLP